MRIVQVSQSYHPRPGGVTEHVHHVTTELRARGHDVTVVTANFGGAASEPGVIRVGRNALVPINGAWVNMTLGRNLTGQLRAVFAHLAPDVVHTHCPLAPTLPLAALRAASPDTRVVGTFHAAATTSTGYRFFRKPLGHYWNRLDARIAVSTAALELVHAYFPGEYVIVPNGVDTRRFSPHHKPMERFGDDAFNILFVGRLDKRKGVKYLFDAAARASRRTQRRIRIMVVGDDGLRRWTLPRLPRGVELVLAGVVPNGELPRYFVSADLFCSPATGQESFGIVLLEAMASGIPVVASAIPGYLTVLRDRWNALVVPPRNANALCEAILEVMDDEALRWTIRSNGLESARAYRWSTVVDGIEAVYYGERPAQAACPGDTADGPLRAQKV